MIQIDNSGEYESNWEHIILLLATITFLVHIKGNSGH